ncbi:hypothetical protein OHR68_39475 [Spirillospora sp. NBC_00431]
MAVTAQEKVIRYRAPDGSLISIAASGYDLTDHWSADVLVRLRRPYAGVPKGRQLREFHVAPIHNYDGVLKEVINGRWVHTVESQGGTFLVGHTDEGEQGIAIWRGRWHEIATWLAEPRMAGSRALSYFEGLQFKDAPDGLRVISQAAHAEDVEVRDVDVYVPTVGLLSIQPVTKAHQLVPSWSGAKTKVGEIWREETSAPDDPTEILLLHATSTTVTTLNGEGNNKGNEGPRVKFLQALTELSWVSEKS